MPKLTGVFESFKDLDQILVSDITRWLKAKEQDLYLENYKGNRMLYPQTIAVTAWDMQIDLAILREYIRRHTESYYNSTANQLIIPEEFIARFPPITRLISAYLDVLKIENSYTTILLTKPTGNFVAGSLVIPDSDFKGDSVEIEINDQPSRLKLGDIHQMPIQDSQAKVRFEGLEDSFVHGGELGILVDLRVKDKEDSTK